MHVVHYVLDEHSKQFEPHLPQVLYLLPSSLVASLRKKVLWHCLQASDESQSPQPGMAVLQE